jgi:hypothetical protein
MGKTVSSSIPAASPNQIELTIAATLQETQRGKLQTDHAAWVPREVNVDLGGHNGILPFYRSVKSKKTECRR